MCVESIFQKAKNGKQSKHSDRRISAEQLKQQGALNGLIQLGDGYKFLNSLQLDHLHIFFEKVKKYNDKTIRPCYPIL